MPRHGKATKPSTSAYYRQDPCIRTEIDRMLDDGLSTDAIYSKLTSENAKTASETIRDPKVISNRKYEKEKEFSCINNKNDGRLSEAELIIGYLKENEYGRSVNFTPKVYSTVNFQQRMLSDIEGAPL